MLTPDAVQDILEHANVFLIEDMELHNLSSIEREQCKALIGMGKLIHTLADALREVVGALRDIATDQHRGWYVRRECAREVLASIEAKVPKEWLDGGEV